MRLILFQKDSEVGLYSGGEGFENSPDKRHLHGEVTSSGIKRKFAFTGTKHRDHCIAFCRLTKLKPLGEFLYASDWSENHCTLKKTGYPTHGET